jgi:hypothetical protein
MIRRAMSDQQSPRHVYDDSDLTSEEMLAAAASHLDDPEDWRAPGQDGCDRDGSEETGDAIERTPPVGHNQRSDVPASPLAPCRWKGD